jgi:hypothetical protein
MPTAKELINASGRLIGELRSGRSFSDIELADMLVSLNQMLGEWSQEQILIFRIATDQVIMTGAASYTMGTGGTITTARPVEIIAASCRTANGASVRARIVDAGTWRDSVLDENETGLVAELVWPDYGMPLITLRLWPKPAAGTLVIDSLKPLTAFTALTDPAVLPEGYEEALVYNFAVKLAAEFGKQPSPEVSAVAGRAREAIAKTNAHLMASPPIPVPAAPASAR